MKSVALIEASCFDIPWDQKRIHGFMDRPSTWGFVAKQGKNTVGYLLQTETHYGIRIDRIAISPMYRRKKLATDLVEMVQSDLCTGCQKINVYVPESCLEGQLFFKRIGFAAVKPFVCDRPGEDEQFVKMSRRQG